MSLKINNQFIKNIGKQAGDVIKASKDALKTIDWKKVIPWASAAGGAAGGAAVASYFKDKEHQEKEEQYKEAIKKQDAAIKAVKEENEEAKELNEQLRNTNNALQNALENQKDSENGEVPL